MMTFPFQVECNIGFNQKKLIEFCKQRDIQITAYCPLGQPNPSKKDPPFLFDDRIKAMGAKYNKSAAQVALRYLVRYITYFISYANIVLTYFHFRFKLARSLYLNRLRSTESSRISTFSILS